MAIYPSNVKSAQWRRRIAGTAHGCSAAAAYRDIAETCDDPTVTRIYGERKSICVDQYPVWRSHLSHYGGRKETGKQQGDHVPQRPTEIECSHEHVSPGVRRLSSLVARTLIGLFATCLAGIAPAAVFPMPPPGSNMIGTLRAVTIANPDATLLDIARHFDLGYAEITEANPMVSAWVPTVGTRVIIPTEFILPPGPHDGIVVNIPQRRLFYFTKKAHGTPAQVITFPVSISRAGWKTPLGETRIVAKYRNPSWLVPNSIRDEHLRDGEMSFPTYFPPGPDNPMGMLALQTGFSMIFIHGTNRPWGVGMRTSHGCLHLYPEDAAYLFPRVKPGTPVRIIDQPHVVGIRQGILYMSSFKLVNEYQNELSSANRAVRALLPYSGKESAGTPTYPHIDWPRVFAAAAAHRYLPIPISRDAPELEHLLESINVEPYTYKPYASSANNAVPPPEELQ